VDERVKLINESDMVCVDMKEEIVREILCG
jgi:hypothetical protein